MNIFFRHPDIKFRPEEWGGIVLINLEVVALDLDHYQALVDFTKLEVEALSNPIHQTLLEIGAICRISKEEAMAISDE